MTSHILDRLARGANHSKYSAPGDCIFCDIIAGRQDAHIVAATHDYIAFLDVLPIRTGTLCVADRATSSSCPRTTARASRS